jgi:hypothetical protein
LGTGTIVASTIWPAARNVALRLQMLAKALEQLLNQAGLRKCLSEQPQRRVVRNAVLDAEPQKPRERQPVARLILDLFVRQIVKRSPHQHPKHHHDVDRLAAGATLLLAHRRQNRRLDLRAETLERHHASNHFQRMLSSTLRAGSARPRVVKYTVADLQVGDDEACIGPFRAGLDTRDDPLDAAPAGGSPRASAPPPDRARPQAGDVARSCGRAGICSRR